MKIEISSQKFFYPDYIVKVAHDYAHLEKRIGGLIRRLCAGFCRKCADCCCREDICRESIDSSWLTLVWGLADNHISQYDKIDGWLAASGCQIIAGRPPVCYEFFCDDILNVFDSGPFRDELKQLSKLISITGKRALGNRHLVVLSAEEIALRLNCGKFSDRIANSIKLFNGIYHKIVLSPEYENKGLNYSCLTNKVFQ